MKALQISDGFVLLLAGLFVVDEKNVLPVLLLAAVTHELGHLGMLYLTGGRLHSLQLTLCGAVLRCTLPVGECARAAVCLAGPAVSFVLAAAAMEGGALRLAGASVLLGGFNLLPMPPLDGGMVLEHLCAGQWKGLRRMLGLCTAVMLLAGGILLLRAGGGAWLLLIGVAVLWQRRMAVASRNAAGSLK